jgi:hypothetical protein
MPPVIAPAALAAAALTSPAAAPAAVAGTPAPAAAGPVPPAPNLLIGSVVLGSPISHEGQTYTGLPLVEPSLRDYMLSEKPTGKTDTSRTEATLRLWSIMTGAPAAALRLLKMRDGTKITKWIEAIDPPAKPVVADADIEDLFVQPEQPGSITVTLISPIMDGDQQLTSLTFSEPDVTLGIMLENLMKKGAGEYLKEASMIATMTDKTIPVISQLRLRDLVVIRKAVQPFLGERA